MQKSKTIELDGDEGNLGGKGGSISSLKRKMAFKKLGSSDKALGAVSKMKLRHSTLRSSMRSGFAQMQVEEAPHID